MIYIAVVYYEREPIEAREREALGLRENNAKIFDASARTDLCGSINLGYRYRARLRIRIIGRVNEPRASGKVRSFISAKLAARGLFDLIRSLSDRSCFARKSFFMEIQADGETAN